MADKDPNFGVQGRRGGMGGKYATKSVNLGLDTLRRAGAGKAAKKEAVSISDTSRNFDEGRTVGPDGRPITGVIELEDGSTAVYMDGRRVQAADARRADRSKGSDRSGGSDSSSPRSGGGKGDGGGTGDGGDSTDTISAKAQRLKDNKGVAGGTVKPGARGHGVRSYNDESGRWDRIAGVSGATAASSQSRRPAAATGGTPAPESGRDLMDLLDMPRQGLSAIIHNPPRAAGALIESGENAAGSFIDIEKEGIRKIIERLANPGRSLGNVPSTLGRGVDRILDWMPGSRADGSN